MTVSDELDTQVEQALANSRLRERHLVRPARRR
jgi:hypothetical protein